MGKFTVSVAELHETADIVARAGFEVADSASRRWSVEPTSVGHNGLADALADFHRASHEATGRLIGAQAETAVRLAETADAYLDADSGVESLIGGSAGPDLS